jgi:hypothetical protein
LFSQIIPKNNFEIILQLLVFTIDGKARLWYNERGRLDFANVSDKLRQEKGSGKTRPPLPTHTSWASRNSNPAQQTSGAMMVMMMVMVIVLFLCCRVSMFVLSSTCPDKSTPFFSFCQISQSFFS